MGTKFGAGTIYARNNYQSDKYTHIQKEDPLMSKYQLVCSCVSCRTPTTTQSLKAHFRKCTALPKNTCQQCGTLTNNEKFCSSSCRAKFINPRRPKKHKGPSRSELRRQAEFQRFLDGMIAERTTLRKHLSIHNGYVCVGCGLSDWNNKPITLIVDHIDGNAGNNLPSNLRLLCPNCNSQTETFGGRNKGNGRKSRGLSLS